SISSKFAVGDPDRHDRHDDLKEMLDSNKDSLKLEAMKRIVAMIARGKNASDLFPAVVKNVACKNIEVKKLVYVYLVRYAEEQQDLALLSISTFQRGLKDPNQLIRASALRVLSSIRVTIIVPIMMLAIKEAASDMSPYVRKTAAHAIPKLYSLDPEQKDQLIEVIEKLLADKTTLVAGSVVMAFEEVCPERIDLIHKNYRKLCNLLIDVEEWGQVVIINMLTRYARTQFLNPNINDEEEKEKKADALAMAKRKPYVMDPDHRLLLRNTKPLLQSRNAAVVMAVAQLYFHLAPKAEVGVIAKALVRLLRSHSEVQFVVLQNVATMTIKRRGMFEPYLKSFYIRSTDPTQIKVLKLEVLTNLANETNISTILREFQTYIKSMDKDFVAATIQAIGRCATNIGEVRDTCLNGLVQLLSNRDELVVAESVVVIKKLLQMQPEKHSDIIKHMAKLTDNIQVPMARASILWLIGEYCEHVPKIAPDVLRKMAKSFTNEEDIVKLQIINLAAKLYLTNSKQTKLLTQYVLNLAKYDQNYDIRDRARFIRQLIVPTEKSGALSKYAKKLFLALKPAPVLESPFKDRDHFQLGSLSHLLNAKAGGYQELPDWPETAPDPSVRNVEVKESVRAVGTVTCRDTRAPWVLQGPKYSPLSDPSESDSASSSDSGGSSSNESGSGSESGESEDGSESDDEEEEEEDEDEKGKKKKKNELKKPVQESERLETLPSNDVPGSNVRMWIHLIDFLLSLIRDKNSFLYYYLVKINPIIAMTMSCPVFLTLQTISPSSALKNFELLHRITGEGLSVDYCFSRQPFSPDANMVAVQMQFTNNGAADTKNLHIEDVKLQSGMRVKEFPEIELLPAGETATAVLGIDFCDSTQAANFQLCTHAKKFFVSIQPPVGELMRPVFLTENEFKKEQGQLMGMNEIAEKLTLDAKCRNEHAIVQRVTAAANLSRVPPVPPPDHPVHRFAGRTVTSSSLVLVTVATKEEGAAQLTVNCEKMVIGTMLVKDILLALTQ
uniref:AP-3 complex subunit beta n=1 Tax=Takifugu rubripes TaxID=31033 RepID=A0A674PRG2_TAKRU